MFIFGSCAARQAARLAGEPPRLRSRTRDRSSAVPDRGRWRSARAVRAPSRARRLPAHGCSPVEQPRHSRRESARSARGALRASWSPDVATNLAPPMANIPQNNPPPPTRVPSLPLAGGSSHRLCHPTSSRPQQTQICVSEKSVVAAIGGYDVLALPGPRPLLHGRTTRLVDVHSPGFHKKSPSVSEIGGFRRL